MTPLARLFRSATTLNSENYLPMHNATNVDKLDNFNCCTKKKRDEIFARDLSKKNSAKARIRKGWKMDMNTHLTHNAARQTAVAQFGVRNLLRHHAGGGDFVVDPLRVGTTRARFDDVHRIP